MIQAQRPFSRRGNQPKSEKDQLTCSILRGAEGNVLLSLSDVYLQSLWLADLLSQGCGRPALHLRVHAVGDENFVQIPASRESFTQALPCLHGIWSVDV